MYCSRCGHNNPDDANFCARCGTALAVVSEDTTLSLQVGSAEREETSEDEELQISIDELRPGQGLLVVKRGPNAGSKFLLDRDVTSVGRHPSSDIFLDDITVSRRHVEVLRESGGRFLVKDVGSLNGSYVNRERVDVAELSSGDELQIGRFKLVFFTGTGES